MRKLELAKVIPMESYKIEQALPESSDQIRWLSFQERMGLHPGTYVSCQISGVENANSEQEKGIFFKNSDK